MNFKEGDMVRIAGLPDSPFNGAEGFVRHTSVSGCCWVDVPTLGEHYACESRLTKVDAVHNVPAMSGGCWYCETFDEHLVFSMEFDTNVHVDCIRKRLREAPDDLEAMFFAEEFELFTAHDPDRVIDEGGASS